MQKLFKELTVQQGLVILSLVLALLIAFELNYFITGFLGAVALYVVTRRFYLNLVEKKKWNKNLATSFVIFLIIVSFGIPIWIILEILIPQINDLVRNPQDITSKFQPVIKWIQENEFIQRFDFEIDNQQIINIVNKVLAYVPSTLNWVGQLFANIFVALFILYFMLISNRRMENYLKDMLPFKERSKQYFIKENYDLIRSNAYGVPILAIAQGIIAIIGYTVFGVDNAVFWGLMTGLASVIPVVGTMVIWIPICIYQIATGDVNGGLMLALYCLVLVGGIDNVLRFTLLKKMADIHPIITVFGVLLGLQLFGAMGLVFGPLVLSLPAIFYNVYRIEKEEKEREDEQEWEIPEEFLVKDETEKLDSNDNLPSA